MQRKITPVAETIQLAMKIVFVFLLNGFIALLLGGIVAGLLWAVRVVVLGSENGNFLGSWSWSFWILYVLMVAEGIRSIYQHTIKPARAAAKKYGVSFAQGLDYRHYSEAYVRFLTEKPDGYAPWDDAQFLEYRLEKAHNG